MTSAHALRAATLLAFLAGLGLLAVLVVHHGVGRIGAVVASAGWGLLLVTVYRAANLVPDTIAWRVLFRRATRPPPGPLFLFRWIGESINNLLPVAQVGGDLVRARLAARLTGRGAEAGATVVVDFTAGILAQVIYGILGVALLASTGDGPVSGGLVLGMVIAALMVGALWLVQYRGIFRRLAGLARIVVRGPGWTSLSGSAADLDREVTGVHGRRGELLIAVAWRLVSWILHAGETWIALKALGSSAGLAEAFILDSISAFARSAAFMVPGGLGVQDGALVVLGGQLGLTGEMSLALALVKRVRELISGVPGIVVWMVMTGRRFGKSEGGSRKAEVGTGG